MHHLERCDTHPRIPLLVVGSPANHVRGTMFSSSSAVKRQIVHVLDVLTASHEHSIIPTPNSPVR